MQLASEKFQEMTDIHQEFSSQSGEIYSVLDAIINFPKVSNARLVHGHQLKSLPQILANASEMPPAD